MILCSFLWRLRKTALESHNSKQMTLYEQITAFIKNRFFSKSHQPSGLRWSSQSLLSTLYPFRGEVYLSPYPLSLGLGPPGRWTSETLGAPCGPSCCPSFFNSFFDGFLGRFWVDLGSQPGSPNPQTSLKN